MENELDFVGSWLEIGMTIAAVAAGAVTVLVPFLKRRVRIKNHANKNLDYPENFQWSTHTILHEILTELRVIADAGRTQIVQFHNTGQFLDGISMKKFSIIAFSMLPIRRNKEIIGYIMTQWCSWNKVDSIDDDSVIQQMESARDKIEVKLLQQLKSL